MALAVLDGMTILPALGAAVLLPSTLATALRLEDDLGDATPTSVDARGLLQQILDEELNLSFDRISLIRERQRDAVDAIPSTLPPQGYEDEDLRPRPGLDTWSVVWYCGMFAAFTSLFLIMPCSQVLCRAGLLQGHSDPRLRARSQLGAFQAFQSSHGYATPPPPYKQFAPPAYEDIVLDLDFTVPPGKAVPVLEKDKEASGVYVIPLRPETEVPVSSQSTA